MARKLRRPPPLDSVRVTEMSMVLASLSIIWPAPKTWEEVERSWRLTPAATRQRHRADARRVVRLLIDLESLTNTEKESGANE